MSLQSFDSGRAGFAGTEYSVRQIGSDPPRLSHLFCKQHYLNEFYVAAKIPSKAGIRFCYATHRLRSKPNTFLVLLFLGDGNILLLISFMASISGNGYLLDAITKSCVMRFVIVICRRFPNSIKRYLIFYFAQNLSTRRKEDSYTELPQVNCSVEVEMA